METEDAQLWKWKNSINHREEEVTPSSVLFSILSPAQADPHQRGRSTELQKQ